ncbi:MAG: hypothetical protein JSS32_09525 [Verrucomicrobia bacterium]|nr:hypothetical protein [Verrucomicrobiota bacterium]
MKELIEARVSPKKVWEAWERAHAVHGQGKIESGQKGVSKAEGKSAFKYQILEVKLGESFSILWKTLFVRLIFTHTVKPSSRGSEISYGVDIRGPFAWPIRWALGKKIQRNISQVLKAIVKQLEDESERESRNGRSS